MIVQNHSPVSNPGRQVMLYRHTSASVPMTSVQTTDLASSFLFIPTSTSSLHEEKQEESALITTSGYLRFSAFIYSLTNITSLAIPYILKDTLLLSPSQLGLFSAVCATPSFLKPLYSFVIPRTRRSVALVLCSSIQATAFITIGTAVIHGSTSVPLVLGCLLTHSAASSIGMYIRDSMTIELVAETNRSTSEHAAHSIYAELSMISRVGLVPVAYLSGYLLSFISPAQIILAASVFPAVIAFSACLLDTQPVHQGDTRDEWKLAVCAIQDSKSGLMSTVTGRSLFLSVIPSYTDAMFFYYTDYLGFDAEFMGKFQFLGAIAGIVASALSKATMKYVNPRKVANLCQWISIPLFSSVIMVTQYPQMPYIGAFVLVRHFFVDFINSLTSLPAAMELMQSAPAGAEGTYLALVGTIGNVGGALNSVVSSVTMSFLGISATNYENLTALVTLTNGLTAITTPVVLFRDTKPTKEVEEIEESVHQRGA